MVIHVKLRFWQNSFILSVLERKCGWFLTDWLLLTAKNVTEVLSFLPNFKRCARSYHRVNVSSDMYLGKCEPCNCNGHTEDCDPATGQCLVSHLAVMGLVLLRFHFATRKLMCSQSYPSLNLTVLGNPWERKQNKWAREPDCERDLSSDAPATCGLRLRVSHSHTNIV